MIDYALTTRTKAKTFLKISSGVTTHDTLIDDLIRYVTDFIESLCNRRFKETTYTNEDYDAPNGDKVFFRHYPVSTLTTAKYRSGGTLSVPTYTDFGADDYLLYGDEGYLKLYFKFTNAGFRDKLLRFTYVAGYKIDFANEETPASHNLPFDITLLANQLVQRCFNMNDGIQSEATEGQSISYAKISESDLTPDQRAIIQKYQNNTLTG